MVRGTLPEFWKRWLLATRTTEFTCSWKRFIATGKPACIDSRPIFLENLLKDYKYWNRTTRKLKFKNGLICNLSFESGSHISPPADSDLDPEFGFKHLISFFFNCFHSRHLQVFELQMQLISECVAREAPSLHLTKHFAPPTGAPLSQSSVTGGITP